MAHTNDKVCLTIVAFLVRDSKVLLANHPRYDTWLPVGGHINPAEDTDEALYREIREETGLDPSAVRIFSEKPDISMESRRKRISLLTPAYVDRHNVGDRDHVAFVYFGEVLDGREILKREEHKELHWFSREDLKKNSKGIKSDIVWYALQALKKAGADQNS